MSWLWWAIGAFGVSGVLLMIFGWPVIIGTKLGRMALAVGAGIAAGFTLLARARRQGADAERERQRKEDERFIEQDRQSDARIDRATDDELDRMLREPPKRPGAANHD